METSLHKSLLGNAVKEEKNTGFESSNDDEQGLLDETVLRIGAGKGVKDEDAMMPQSPNQKNLTSSKQMNQLESAKAEMDEVMEENHRLRMYLDQMLKDYRTLQNQCKDQAEKSDDCTQSIIISQNQTEEYELFPLCLGRSSSHETTKNVARKRPVTTEGVHEDIEGNKQAGLKLGLECNYEALSRGGVERSPPISSPDNSLEEERKLEMGEVKNSSDIGGDDDQILQQNAAKRARVSVRYRCDTPTMNDGCQWRKYGQKISKGNPCPRAYYRCTVAPSCPVRKQVQRCVEDMSILVTTYEGTHNHPLPVSATAMASTTSAAVSMITSGSSSSTSGLGLISTPSTSTATASNLMNGLNFYLSNNNSPRSKPFYIPNSPFLSSPASHPTITLDLTASNPTHLNRLSSIPPRFPSTNLNFSTSLEPNTTLPISWSNGVLSYNQQFNNVSQNSSSLNFGTQYSNETLYQSCMQKYLRNPNQQSQAVADNSTIAAATKAITSDPNFQSAVAAALATIIGGSGASTLGNENGSQITKTAEPFPILSSFPSLANASKYTTTTSIGDKSSPSTSSQPASLKFLPPSFPLSNSKSSKPNSPGEHDRDRIV